MSRKFNDEDGRPVPFGRLARLAGFGGMAANIAGGMALNTAKQLASGKRPKVTDLLMTPANALKVTHQLANMRGAAMKIGQMISMDSGDILPKELADILARLRSEAQHMPRPQLNKALTSIWGDNWTAQFSTFHYRPIAAASIGQVHRAQLPNGDMLAIKVQYPGVKDSIDSDVNNVASLLRVTGLVPGNLDVKPVIEEGRRQLHEEADYIREASYLSRFGELLSDDRDFEVPHYYPEYSNGTVLAMSYIESCPIEDMIDASQETRDRITYLLIELLLRELFEFKVMQTDPNFANYRYNTRTEAIVLLDFGASRDIDDALSGSYRNIMQAALSGDRDRSFDAATTMGFISENMPAKYKAAIINMLEIALEPLQVNEDFDFGDNQISERLRTEAMELVGRRELWHLPPTETIFIQRKIGGVFMLATRLRAKVNVRALMQSFIE